MNDDQLEQLGNYFVENKVREKFKITFERFVDLVRNGLWEIYMK